MSAYIVNQDRQFKLPFVDGLGRFIDLKLNERYTIEYRGSYYLALKPGETEIARPANLPVMGNFKR